MGICMLSKSNEVHLHLYDLGIDFKGALLLLPSIFKEKIEDFIILGEVNA